MTRCTATAKSTGQRCKRYCAKGKTVCYYHGGAPGSGAPKGSANNFKHGLATPTPSRALNILKKKDAEAYNTVLSIFKGFKKMAGWDEDDPRNHQLLSVATKIVLEDLALAHVIQDGLSKTEFVEGGIRTVEHYLLRAIARLSTDIRQTLKDLGILKQSINLQDLSLLWKQEDKPE